MIKKINVVFLWESDPVFKKYFKQKLGSRKNIKLIFPKIFSDNNLLRLARTAYVLVGWRPAKSILENSLNLKALINPGTGIKHHIPVFRELNRKRKILLINSHGHAYSTAQHAVAMLLTLTNKIIIHHQKMKEGKWATSDDKDVLSATIRLKHRNIGLLGYGAINRYVHKFLSGFENKFHIYKRHFIGNFKNKKNCHIYGVKDFDRFLKNSDILIIAVPHTSKTEGMISLKELKLLGKNAIVVNVARGLIIDEKSLYTALKKNYIAGAAVDVWYNYRPAKDKFGREYPYKYPFHKLDNIVMSPHRAASPFDDTERLDDIIENLKRISEGRKDLLNMVNLKEEY